MTIVTDIGSSWKTLLVWCHQTATRRGSPKMLSNAAVTGQNPVKALIAIHALMPLCPTKAFTALIKQRESKGIHFSGRCTGRALFWNRSRRLPAHDSRQLMRSRGMVKQSTRSHGRVSSGSHS
ncbi:hypothetical protein SynBIOSU31_03040 [Synechococcus sp. BIOS-U3-1]|nr:hypothetical protein SynBIOSU31_03040 [Synechococcus sp. BIOS-U3-1]